MESIKGYDHWKTIPPEPEEEKQEYCTCCGIPVYSDDSLYTFDGQTLCEECVKEITGGKEDGRDMDDLQTGLGIPYRGICL